MVRFQTQPDGAWACTRKPSPRASKEGRFGNRAHERAERSRSCFHAAKASGVEDIQYRTRLRGWLYRADRRSGVQSMRCAGDGEIG